MSYDYIDEDGVTAVDVRGHLAQLQAERSLALDTGLASVGSYMAELDEEIELCRRLYVASAVTEIASLRGELYGVNAG